MIRRVILAAAAFILIYAGIVQVQVYFSGRKQAHSKGNEAESPAGHRVYSFSFTKYAPGGGKEIEIEGDSADILAENVFLMNVVAKAYAEETPVTLTADRGNYDKKQNRIYLNENVVATTENGTRLLTERLNIYPADRVMESEVETEVKKDNISIDGLGARGDSNLKKVNFKKNVTVVVQDAAGQGPTVITSDGPLLIDYDKNIATFESNVVAKDRRGKLTADEMDVYYNKITREVSRIVATGNVVIENRDGNKTISDSAIYLADEGRVILGGDTEALYYRGEGKSLAEGMIF